MENVTELYGRSWSKNEYVVVLDAYFRTRSESYDAVEKTIYDVSQAIGRTHSSVAMRFANFASVDPEARQLKRGLNHVDRRCRAIFDEWRDRREILSEVAAALRSDIDDGQGKLFDTFRVRLPYAFRRYELGDPIGHGAFGAVFSCTDTRTDELRAIKILRLAEITESSMLHRFRREIKVLRTVSHPHVITLHEDNLETESRFPAFVMDLAECTLPDYICQVAEDQQLVNRPTLVPAEAVTILSQVMEGVIALHDHTPPIVHRDINPSNVLRMPDGRWVIADFTLAKFLLGCSDNTYVTMTTHRGWGTTYFTAPEQWRDFKSVDQRSDIYSLGVLMWELFSSASPLPQLAALHVPPELDPVIRRAMSSDPSSRFQSVRDLQQEMIRAAATITSAPPAPTATVVNPEILQLF